MADVKLHYIEDSAWLQYHEVRTGAGGTVELVPVSCANWESSRGSAVPLDLRPDSAAAGVLSLQEDSVSCDSTDCQKARWPKHKLHCGDVPYEPEFQLPTFTPPRPLYTTPPPPALHRQLDFLERYPSFNYFLLLRNKVFGIRIPPMGIPPVEGRRAEAMTCSSMSAKTEAAGKLCMMLLGQIILSLQQGVSRQSPETRLRALLWGRELEEEYGVRLGGEIGAGGRIARLFDREGEYEQRLEDLGAA